MKKFSKLLVAAVLALSLGLTAAGCGGNGNTGGDNPGGDNPGGDNPGGNTGVTATLDFYTSVNIIEQSALQQVANAYSDMQYEKGNDITIMIRNNTDPAYLKPQHFYRLPESGPITARILHNQPRNANG